MRSLRVAALAGALAVVAQPAAAQRGGGPGDENRPAPKTETLVYADFEAADNGRAVSARGGPVTVTSYQESDVHATKTKGAPNAEKSPELVRIKPDDPNRLGKIEFSFMAPNRWAGASIEIRGQADVDGKAPPDDVTGYKKITFQLFAKGAEYIRVEAVSRGHGTDLQVGYPQMSFKVRPGLNTYEVALKSLVQPGWVEIKIDPKKVLQKLTQLNITAYCEPCTTADGILVVDDVTFVK